MLAGGALGVSLFMDLCSAGVIPGGGPLSRLPLRQQPLIFPAHRTSPALPLHAPSAFCSPLADLGLRLPLTTRTLSAAAGVSALPLGGARTCGITTLVLLEAALRLAHAGPLLILSPHSASLHHPPSPTFHHRRLLNLPRAIPHHFVPSLPWCTKRTPRRRPFRRRQPSCRHETFRM